MTNTLAVNGRFLQKPTTGIERYAREISARLPGQPRVLAPSSGLQGLSGNLWEQLVLPGLVTGDEVLWSPTSSGPLAVPRQVVTLHDTLALFHPEWYQPDLGLWYRFMLPRLMKRARSVITASEYSRRRLLDSLNLAPESVVHVPAGVDTGQFYPVKSEETLRIRQRFHLTGDYFLFVGRLQRQNLDLLLDAWVRVYPAFPNMRLVVAGGVLPRGLVGEKKPLTGVQTLGYVAEADLPALYSGALAFISPTVEEGFGLAALEAMACGVPVIAADGGAYPEVVGDAGLLVDPFDREAMPAAMRKVVTDAQLQADLCYRGLERARLFTWEAAASRVMGVIETC